LENTHRSYTLKLAEYCGFHAGNSPRQPLRSPPEKLSLPEVIMALAMGRAVLHPAPIFYAIFLTDLLGRPRYGFFCRVDHIIWDAINDPILARQ
jgi:hypothetical protein